MPELVTGSFTVDHLGVYLGFIQADTDDGLITPLFTFDTVLHIIADWIAFEGLPGEPPAEARYDAERDTFLLFEPAIREWHELAGERFGPNTLYALGRDLWAWRQCERPHPH